MCQKLNGNEREKAAVRKLNLLVHCSAKLNRLFSVFGVLEVVVVGSKFYFVIFNSEFYFCCFIEISNKNQNNYNIVLKIFSRI